MITPVVTNKPATLCSVKPLKICPTPKSVMPATAVFLAPAHLINLAFNTANNELQAHVKLPTNDNVAGLERFSFTRAAWMTPQLYVVPTNQKESMLQAKTTTQP